MPSSIPTVPINPETGLPALPENHLWVVDRSGYYPMQGTYYSGAQIFKREQKPWSDWVWAGNINLGDYLIKERNPEVYETERIWLDKLIPLKRGLFGAESIIKDSFLWRYRNAVNTKRIFVRQEAAEEDAPTITEDNILEETTKTLLAWQQKQKEDAVLGEYPPRKAGK